MANNQILMALPWRSFNIAPEKFTELVVSKMFHLYSVKLAGEDLFGVTMISSLKQFA